MKQCRRRAHAFLRHCPHRNLPCLCTVRKLSTLSTGLSTFSLHMFHLYFVDTVIYITFDAIRLFPHTVHAYPVIVNQLSTLSTFHLCTWCPHALLFQPAQRVHNHPLSQAILHGRRTKRRKRPSVLPAIYILCFMFLQFNRPGREDGKAIILCSRESQHTPFSKWQENLILA